MLMAKQNSNDADAIVWRGIAFFKQDRMEVAEQHMKQAIKIDPDHKQAKKWLKNIKKYNKNVKEAQALLDSRKWSEAEQLYRTVIIPILQDPSPIVEKLTDSTGQISWDFLAQLPAYGDFNHPQLYRMMELECQCQLEQGKYV